MTVPKKQIEKKPCLICGTLTSGYISIEWEEAKEYGYKKEQWFIQNPEAPLNDLDIVGYPICKDCYKAEFEE